MSRLVVSVILCWILLPPASDAVLCVPDPVPASTLLIPSFTVDVSPEACADATGKTTLFSVNNAGSAPRLAHVTLWTDQSIPVLDFDIYLTGYDVQTINLRDLFCRGVLPRTGFAVSPNGSISGDPVAFPSCNNTTTPGDAPNYETPFSDALIGLLQEWFTGRESTVLVGECAGSGQAGDTTAVGYVTIDVVTDCVLLFPSDADYQTDALGHANALWGDYYFQDPRANVAQGFHAVHLESAPEGFFDEGDRTFYGRYNQATAIDRREPLPTTYATRFARGGAFDETAIHIWRESNEQASPYLCSQAGPSWWPLNRNRTVSYAWNESESVCDPYGFTIPNSSPLVPPMLVAPNGVNVCGLDPSSTTCQIETCGFDFGWLYLDLNAPVSVYGDDTTQAWVTTANQAAGRFSVGVAALPMDGGCTPRMVPVNGPRPSDAGPLP